MEKKNIKEYLQEMLDRWNKYDELDGFVADNFRVDLEKTLEYWDLRIKDNEQELDKAREEGRKEVLENELFIGDYDVLERGLRIRTVGRENFLAQIYKTCKDEYDWAFGTATYDQAIKQIENSLNSTLTPYVGTDKMVNEARIKVLSKLLKEQGE